MSYKATNRDLAMRLIENTVNHTYYCTRDVQRLALVAAGYSGPEVSTWRSMKYMQRWEIHYKGSPGLYGELASCKVGAGEGDNNLRLFLVRRPHIPGSDLEKLAGFGSDFTGLPLVAAALRSGRGWPFAAMCENEIVEELGDLNIRIIGRSETETAPNWSDDEIQYWLARGEAARLKGELNQNWRMWTSAQENLGQVANQREQLQSSWHNAAVKIAALGVKLGKE